MSGDVVYRDYHGDDAALEVSTGGLRGIMVAAESGSDHVAVSLDRDAVKQLHAQLGAWLKASR